MTNISKTISSDLTRFTGPTFTNPLVTSLPDSPDPCLTYQAGFYYFCTVLDNQIWVWKATSLSGIDGGEKMLVWQPVAGRKQIWAPELHFLQGKWYIYYAASEGRNASHRMYVLESLSDEPQGPYQEIGQLACGDSQGKWAIDGTILHYADAYYFLWSGWPGYKNGLQNIYIAPMSNPWTISGPRTLLSTPEYDWEGWINEGPQVLQHDGRLFLIYSANASWTKDYCLGMLIYQGGPRDLLDATSWVKSATPVFQSGNGVYSVGHCSFTKSPDGSQDWLLYHGKDSMKKGWANRRTRAQPFNWSPDNRPDFGQPVPSGKLIAVPQGE